MPWSIVLNAGDCSGYAVVKDSTGEIEGCHRTREAAQDQLAALHASEGDRMSHSIREVRAVAEVSTSGRIVEGYAAVFNIDTDISGAFRERIASDAFPSDLTGVPLLWDHDTGSLLARAPKTLALKSDKRGLHFRAELPDTTLGRDLAVLMNRGDLSGASFAFTVAEDNWDDDLRTIARIERLYDVSLVTTPAYPDAQAALRSRPDIAPSLRPHWTQSYRLWLAQHPTPEPRKEQ